MGAYGNPELYDLDADPLAAEDVAPDNPGVVTDLHARFVQHLGEHGASEAFRTFWENGPEGGSGTWAIDYPR